MKLLSFICLLACILVVARSASAFVTKENYNNIKLQRQLMRGFNLVKPDKPDGPEYYTDMEDPGMTPDENEEPAYEPVTPSPIRTSRIGLQEPMESKIGVVNRHGNPYRSMNPSVLRELIKN